MKDLNPIEAATVPRQSASVRYVHSLKRIADSGRVWSVRTPTGFVLLGGSQGEAIPIWPHEAYALQFCHGQWSDGQPHRIELSMFLERWIPGASRDGRMFAVFPVLGPSDEVSAAEVPPGRLSEDLQGYLEQLE